LASDTGDEDVALAPPSPDAVLPPFWASDTEDEDAAVEPPSEPPLPDAVLPAAHRQSLFGRAMARMEAYYGARAK
jgi:hypothetical protein